MIQNHDEGASSGKVLFGANQVATLEVNDGETLEASNVQSLVDAMASFEPPALGETDLTTDMHTQLDNVIVAGWE